MSFDVIDNWHKELEVMNHNKRDRKFDYSDSFMKLLGYAIIYFGLPYKQTEWEWFMYIVMEFQQFLILHQSIKSKQA